MLLLASQANMRYFLYSNSEESGNKSCYSLLIFLLSGAFEDNTQVFKGFFVWFGFLVLGIFWRERTRIVLVTLLCTIAFLKICLQCSLKIRISQVSSVPVDTFLTGAL